MLAATTRRPIRSRLLRAAGFALGRFVPTSGRGAGRLIAFAYATSTALALALSTGFVLVAPAVSARLAPLFAGTAVAVGFVASVALWCVFSLQDGILTALRRAPWVPGWWST